MAKKKKKTINTAIVVLNILIIGIIIMLIVLTVMYFNNSGNKDDPEETTTIAEETTTITELTTTTTVSMTKVSTTMMTVDDVTTVEGGENTTTPPTSSYDQSFFKNDLFIGDSIGTGFSLYNFLPIENVYAMIGMNPESALTVDIDGEKLTDRITAMQPRNTYIMLGTNGLAFMDADYLATSMLNLIAAIEQASPTTNIVILTIPPVTAAHEAEGNETMALVNAYNTKLKSICSEGGYTCIDVCTLLQDSAGYFSADYAEQDGLHFLGAAYLKVLGYIQDTLE